MNTGVSTTPCASTSRARRAAPSVATTAKDIGEPRQARRVRSRSAPAAASSSASVAQVAGVPAGTDDTPGSHALTAENAPFAQVIVVTEVPTNMPSRIALDWNTNV